MYNDNKSKSDRVGDKIEIASVVVISIVVIVLVALCIRYSLYTSIISLQ